MREVLLSHDDKVLMYAVPDEVAEHLEEYCLEFATNWIWKNPYGEKLLKEINGIKCAVYGATDFIDYLNEWIFPDQKSTLIRQLDYFDYELPDEYRGYPQFNF